MSLKSIVKCVTLAGWVAFATGAMADGGPSRSVRDPGPPPFTWTGIYVGLNAGYAWADAQNSLEPLGQYRTAAFGPAFYAGNGSSAQTLKGFTGGGQAGMNYQMGALVLGFEVDANIMRVDASRSVSAFNPAAAAAYRFDTTNKIDALYTIRPRIGYAFGTAMVYLTGGLAIADRTFSQTMTCVTLATCGVNNFDAISVNKYAFGWTIGAGFEYAFNRNWTMKTEYLYADLGTFAANSVNSTAAQFSTGNRNDLTVQTVRAGINYKF